MFFVLINENGPDDNKNTYRNLADLEVKIAELILYVITSVCVVLAMWQMRELRYDRKIGGIYLKIFFCKNYIKCY